MQAIIHGRLVSAKEILSGKILLLDEGKIIGCVSAGELPPAAETIDAHGLFISPGFINLHIHGCGGADTMDAVPEALYTMSLVQAHHGVTAFLPTTMTYDRVNIYKALDNIRQVRQENQEPGAKILGAYVEGPFISETYKGAQKADHIVKASWSFLSPYADVICFVLVAPETLTLAELKFLAQQCSRQHIQLTYGHSAADYETAQAALRIPGCHHVTHLFNGMAPLHHRHPGLAGAALDGTADCELIADNIHVHPAFQRLAYRLKGDHLVLITDSMRACGLGNGISELGGQKVWVQNGKATLTDGTIAGSVLTMDQALFHFQHNTGCTIPEAVRLVTLNPAQELGDGRRGTLKVGARADLVFFDRQFRIKLTMVGGRIVYQHD